MKILVVGGADYIGLQMTKYLSETSHEVVVLNNLVCGHTSIAKYAGLIVGDVADGHLLNELLGSESCEPVVHFASHIQVNESVLDPAGYHAIKLTASPMLLDAIRAAQV